MTTPVALTAEEARALIRACSAKAPTGIRNRALIVMLYRGGLRLGEVLSLLPLDVDLARGTVRVRGRGHRARTIGLDSASLELLQRWLAERRTLGIPARRVLFCTLAGAPIHAAYVRQLLPRLAKRAAIDKRVHAQALRHTHAIELASEGHSSPFIQAQLGKASREADGARGRVDAAQLVETMRQRAWSL